ncbi:unnamed protein product, partial [Linum tenue]
IPGQPKRHLLTTGWSVFVSAKRLVAGDSVLFIWNEKNQLLLGIRRATRPQTVMPSSVLSSDSMHIGLLAAAAHAAATNSCFTVFYNPRASPCEFVIPLSKYVKAVYHTRVSVGMRFRMLFETEESSVRRYMGTITGISDLDPVRWPNSHWRSVKVGWDESTAGERQPRVSLWEIEPLTTFPMYPSLFPFRLKRPWHPGSSSFPDSRDENVNSLMWLRGGAGDGIPPMNFQPVNMLPWMQQRVDPSLLRNDQNQWYQAMLAASLNGTGNGDPMRQQFLQFQQQPPMQQYQQHSGNNYHPMLQLQQQQANQQSVSPNILGAHNPVSSDGLPQHLLQQQQLGNQPDNQSQQQEPSYQDPLQIQNDQLHRGQSSVHSPSFSKTDLIDPSTKFLGSTSTIQNMLGSLGPEGSGNLLDLTRIGQSSMTEQLNQEPWVPKYTQAQVNAFTGSMSHPNLYPADKDSTPKLGNGSIEAQSPNNFGMNIESSGLLLPTTVPRVATTSLSDPDVSSMPLSEAGFQNSLYCQQDSSDFLPGTGPVESLNGGPTFVKVYKSGSVGRSLDISRFSNYHELREELAQMFGIEGKLENPHRSGWQLVFVDKENDVLLLGDGPWDAFVNNVWYIKILSPEDVVKMGQQGVESFSPNPSQRSISGGPPDLASGSFGY